MAVDSPSTTISQEFPLKVSGGYFIIARRICESDVASAPPHVREIWLYLIANANFTDNNGIKRGQCLTSYKQIQDALSWKVGYRKVRYSKSQCENAMKWYAKHHMTTAMKTTRGMIVTILKYEDYQDPKNYESHNESHNDATMMPQSCRTIHKKEKNDNECKEESLVRKEAHSMSVYSEPFERFWKEYPKRVKKINAGKQWKIKGGDNIIDKILVALHKHKAWDQWTKDGGKYIPDPERWIKYEQWNNEIPEPVRCQGRLVQEVPDEIKKAWGIE